MSATHTESAQRTRVRPGPLWWAMVGLASLLALTGAVANAVAAGAVGGAVVGVVVAVVVPGLLVIAAVGVEALLRRYGAAAVFGDDEEMSLLPVMGATGFVILVGTALLFIGQSVRGFAVLGGIAEPWAWVFPFVVEAGFVAFAVAYVVAGVQADSVRGAEVSS